MFLFDTFKQVSKCMFYDLHYTQYLKSSCRKKKSEGERPQKFFEKFHNFVIKVHIFNPFL